MVPVATMEIVNVKKMLLERLATRKQLKIVKSLEPVTGVVLKKMCSEKLCKITGKHLCQSLFFNKVAGLGLQLY